MRAPLRQAVTRTAAPLLLAIGAACGAEDPIDTLRSFTADVRIMEPRRSGGAHASCRAAWISDAAAPGPAILCSDSSRRAELASRLEAVRAVEERLASADSSAPSALRLLAEVDLIATAGRGEGSLRAMDRLRLAASLAPNDLDLRNDLAVALLVRSGAIDDPWSTAEALDHLEAILHEGDHPAARFNRALALEQLGLVNEARAAWATVVALEAEPGWRQEAGDRLADLDRWLETRPPDVDGEDVVVGLAAILEESTPERPDPALAPLLSRAETLAANGDDSARLIVESRESLEGAIRAYGRARELWQAGSYDQAAEQYAEARLRADGPEPASRRLRWMASTGEARHRLYVGDPDGALRRFRAIADSGAAAGASEIHAHALYGAGLTLSRMGEAEAARSAIGEARQRFERLEEASNAASARFLDAEILGYTGSVGPALRELTTAVGAFGRDGGNMHQNLLSYTGRLVASRHPRAAVPFHDEAFRLAEANINPQFLVEARIRLAQAEARTGDTARAKVLLEDARAGLPTVRDSSMRARVEAEYDELVGMYLPGLPAPTRDSLLTEAIAHFEESGSTGKLPDLLQRRGRHRLARGGTEDGLADLRRALTSVEAQLASLTNPVGRASLLQARAEALDALVDSRLALGDTVAALVDFDRPRAAASRRSREIWDGAVTREPGRNLAEARAVVSFMVSDAALRAWVVRSSGVTLRTLPVDPNELRRRVDRLRYGLRSGASPGTIAETANWLHERLVEPLLPDLDDVEHLVVVPDGPLNGLPFPVLGTRPGELLERFGLTHAPSVAFALAARPEAAPRVGRTVAASASRWDQDRYPGLPGLPYATEEATAVAALHPEGLHLPATTDELEAGMKRARILHFAGHGIYRADRPDLSELVTADGGLSAARIAGLDLSAMELAVLAACDTQQTSDGREGGLSGLTWSFLEAGADGVIGSLWAVPDSATSAFMVDLHRELARGRTGPDALRKTQLERARESGGDWGWTAFRYEGAAR